MAAVTAAGRGLSVLLLEKMDQAGRKLRITGKGRCNLTNTNTLRDTLPHIGSDARFLRNAYGRFFNRELMDFFEGRGVPLVVERGNRVYPASGKALDIFLALIGELEANPNVTIRKNTTVKAVETFSEEGRRQATAVILERGGYRGHVVPHDGLHRCGVPHSRRPRAYCRRACAVARGSPLRREDTAGACGLPA